MPFGGRGDARRVLRRGERDVKRAGEGERSGKKADRTGVGWNEGRAGGRLLERELGRRIFRANDVPGRRIFQLRRIFRANDVLRVAGFPDEADFSGRAGEGCVGRGGKDRSPRAVGPDGKGRGLSVVSGGTAGCLRWVSPYPLGYRVLPIGAALPAAKKTGGRPCGRPPVSCRTGTVSGCGRRSRPYSYCPDLRRSTSSRVRKRHWPRLRFFFVRPA